MRLPNLKFHSKRQSFLIIFSFAILIFILLLGRAFWLQIWHGDYYALKSSENNVRIYQSMAPRGIIYDRNNKALTDDIPDFNLMVIPADIPKDKEALDKWVKKVAKILKKNDSEIYDFIKSLYKNSTEPVLLALDLSRDTLVELETQMLNLPGVFVNEETKRNYVDGSYFSHLLGYIGKVSNDNLKSDNYYSLSDFIGKDGLELQYEKELRGQHGKIAVAVDSGNNVLRTLVAQEPLPGYNLTLSIDSNLQKLLTDAIESKMSETNSPGAAAVVLNVHSGEILALVSLPNFDNNIFTGNLNVEDYQNIAKSQNWSEFNRAISGTYSSGSTIKPFIAAAALSENIISPDTKIDDTLGYIQVPNQYNPDIIYTYRDWKAHGFVDMRRAIAVSADVYFYNIGGGYKNIKGLGINLIKKYLNLFGFGSDLGIDLPGESKGLIPDPAWKKSVKKETWVTGDTYNVSIGQGDVLVTPLQMASGIAAISNGGILWQPTIVSKIIDSDGKIVKEFKPRAIRSNLIDKDKLEIVKEGMRGAVTEGSARALNDLPIKVAGKTGTAQVTNTFKKTNAWFTGFAPYDNPDIALAIVIEGAGEGSTAAIPIAKEIFWWYFNQNYDSLNRQ